MKEENKIIITYKHYIPDEWIEEVETSVKPVLSTSLKKDKDKEEFYSFSGPEIADIIIFIKDNPYSIFLAPALYDVLKTCVIGLWKKVITLNFDKIKSYKTANSKLKKIKVRYEDSSDRVVNINIEGDISESLIESVVDKAFEALTTEKRDEVFGNENYVDPSSEKKSVELKYNLQTETWEAVDFAELKRKADEFQKRARDKFDS
ncbi:MAG: hypothetical protein RIF36_22535 [Imperialibacter sp.]|uniref:hypothetical protein n=1 Tax=Imperialibacter sp. TaxID=2038411 RepID=UPI0032EF91F7